MTLIKLNEDNVHSEEDINKAKSYLVMTKPLNNNKKEKI